MSYRISGGTVFFALCLVSASALGGADPKLDDLNKNFAEAQNSIKQLISSSAQAIDPEENRLKGLSKTVSELEQKPNHPDPADMPKNPREEDHELDDATRKANSMSFNSKGLPATRTPLPSASFAQVEDYEEEDAEEEDQQQEDNEDNDQENEDEDEDGEDEEEDGEEGEEDEEQKSEGTALDEEDGKEDENDDKDDDEDEDDDVPEDGQKMLESGEESLTQSDDSQRTLVGKRREEHRRRGVSDMPIPVPTFDEAGSTTTATTTGKYPLGYIGPGDDAVEKDYKDKWAVMPDPSGREMSKAWAWDHPIDYHEHVFDGAPGKCEGRRRNSRRRAKCQMKHRRRRNHRRRRSHHRRRAHEYRRRRRRVHRRRRVSKDTSHRRRSHRRRLERGDASATAKIAARKAARGKGSSSSGSKGKGAAPSDEESLMQRSSDELAIDSQGESVLMRRHNFDS